MAESALLNVTLRNANFSEEVIDLLSQSVCRYQPMLDECWMQRLSLTIFLAILCGIGLVGNLTILLVYMDRPVQRGSECFILNMAGVDFFVCLVIMPMTLLTSYQEKQVEAICRLHAFLRYALTIYTVLCLLGVAFDRLMIVCRPYYVASPKAKLYTTRYLISAAVFSCACGVLFGMCHSIYDRNSSNDVIRLDICHPSSINLPHEAVHLLPLVAAIVNMVCFIVISVFYSILYIQIIRRKIWKHRLAHQRSAADDDEETCSELSTNVTCHIKTVRMLMVMSFTYAFSYIPLYFTQFGLISYHMTLFFSYFIHNSINCLIYSFTNNLFREHVRSVFKRRNPFSRRLSSQQTTAKNHKSEATTVALL